MKKDTIFYGIAILSERMISFFTLPILTKKMPMELYGVWSQITVTMGLIIPLVLLGFQTAMVNFFSGQKDNNQEKKNIFFFMSGIVIINLIVINTLTTTFSMPIGKFMFGSADFASYVPLFGYLLSSEAIFELLVGYLRSEQKIKLLSGYYIIKSILRIGVLTLGLLTFHVSLNDILLSLALLQILFVVVIYIKDVFELRSVAFNKTPWSMRWKELMLFALPLVPLNIATWGNNFIDRYLVLHFTDIKQVGVYAVAYSLAAIAGLFYSILGFTLYPKLAQLWNDGRKEEVAAYLQKGIGYYLFLLIPSIASLTIMNESIIGIFSRWEYVSSWVVIFFLSVGIGLFGFYQIFFYITLLAKRSFANLLIMAASVMANIIINLVLIPQIGIVGAALATALSNGILAAWTILISRSAVAIKFPWSVFYRLLTATAVLSVFLLFAKNHISTFTVWSLGGVVVVAGAIYLAMDLMYKNSMLRQLKVTL